MKKLSHRLPWTVPLLVAVFIIGAHSSPDESGFGRLVIESESSTGLHVDDTEAGESKMVPSSGTQSRAYYARLTCPGISECVPMNECPELLQEALRKCSRGDKSLFCGNELAGDPFLCCPRNPMDIRNGCGRTLIQGQNYKGLGAFPFVARVGFKNTNTGILAYPCSGSIISRRVILTAAHCALAKANGHRLSSVRIGEFDVGRDPDCATSGFCAPSPVNHAVSHAIVHPEYTSGQYHHDIALLVLRTPINFTVAAQPICLHPDRADLTVGKRAMIMGWGKMSTTGQQRSPQMQFLDVPLASWESCVRVYQSTGALDSSQSIDGQWMCAGGEGKDACQGFGGAPLVVRENGIYSQIGIMSFGSDDCGAIRVPSVYTSIAHYAHWIADNSPIE